MKLLSCYESIGYSTVRVYNFAYHEDETFELFCDFNNLHIQQGFRGYPGAFAFFIMTDTAPLYMEVMLDEKICFDANTVYAIQVPFNVFGEQGIMIEALFGNENLVVLQYK